MTEIRRVLITGGTGKVGFNLAEGFARAGWQVVFTSRSQERADAFARNLQQLTGTLVHGIAAEFGGAISSSTLIDNLKQLDLLPHCLINNARDRNNLAVDERGRPFYDNWQREFQLSVVVAYELSMELATTPQSPLESIINISSMYGIVAPTLRLYKNPTKESPIHYGVCKAALIHLTKELAVRLAAQRIRVNAISYGGIEGRVDKDFLTRYSELSPQARMLQDDDVAGPALFLASEAAAAITGHNLVADGGWSVW